MHLSEAKIVNNFVQCTIASKIDVTPKVLNYIKLHLSEAICNEI